jgi:hypothetical protein
LPFVHRQFNKPTAVERRHIDNEHVCSRIASGPK